MAQNFPTEKKVVVASWTATVAAFVVGWIVTAVPGLADLASPLQAVIVAALTGLVAWGAGWMAKHSPRTTATPAAEPYNRPGV